MEMSLKEMGAYLKKLRENKGLSTREVYELAKVSNSYLSLVENGHRRASAVVLKKLAPVYGVDYLDLYVKAGYADLAKEEQRNNLNAIPLAELNQTEIPVLGKVKAGYDYLAQENIIGYESIDNVPDPENYYALQVTGDSMEPLFSDGDIAIVHKQDDFDSGNTCIILVNGDEATVKKVVKMDDGIDLIAMNPYYPVRHFTKNEMDEIPVKIIGRVVEARKRKIFE